MPQWIGSSRCDAPAPHPARKGLVRASVPAPFLTPAERRRGHRSALTLPPGRKLLFRSSGFILAALILAGTLAAASGTSTPNDAAQHAFSIGTHSFLLDGQPFQIRCGEIHAPRVPPEYWRHRLQMAKAMGLNTVCAYLFWNLHEPRPGAYNWSGAADAAAFCRIAQEEGLWVILRPGPYACAEWEMGGTPWWMLKEDGVKLRSIDPRYLGPATRYLKEVGRVLGPCQITRGGNIILVQVENEYGFFGSDPAYGEALRQALVDAGIEVPLFQCNPPDQMRKGMLTPLFQAGNFGSDVEKNFAKVRQIQKTGPLFCSEFYPGWFDTWGQPHHLGKPENYLPNLKRMLDMGASFSIYMAHGGTTFGLWSGCDRPFKPDTSSYDYDAPISEAGWITPKYLATRELFSKYLLPGETMPEPPAANPVISLPATDAAEIAPMFDNLPQAIADEFPRTMEKYDQGYGCILYRTQIPAGGAAILEAAAIHDFGYVFLEGKRVGTLDRRSSLASIRLPARQSNARLDILVEPAGRINFGPEMSDSKGLLAPVTLGGLVLKGWQIFTLPLDEKAMGGLKFAAGSTKAPAFWRAEVDVATPGDTFLDLRNWGKGVVWANGHCLGRFWNIGPSQTAYLPGCWLRAGRNEIVILDYVGPQRAEISGLIKPILDDLHPEKDFRQSLRPLVRLDLATLALVHQGSFAPGSDTQEISFERPAKGKWFCLETLSAQDGKPFAAVAELDLLDAQGNALSHNGWTILSVDSQERLGEDGAAENAIDGQTANEWHTEWKSTQPGHPHQLVLNLGTSQTIYGVRYVPRQGNERGRIRDYRIFMGESLPPKQTEVQPTPVQTVH